MDKTLGYIFGSLQLSEAAIAGIVKDLKKQRRLNQLLALLAVLGGVYIYTSESQREKDKVKLDILTRKVEEMNNAKGV